MKKQVLPRRVFNSPLIKFANFKGEHFINLIRLIKPYKNGVEYAIFSSQEKLPNRLFKSLEKAENAFDELVKSESGNNTLLEFRKTQHY